MARWTDAGGPHQFAFMGAASRTLRGERDLDCPKCGAAKLRAYFHVFNPAKRTGTIWVWCPACRTTGHLPRVTPTVDLGPDPFASLSLEQFAALESDPKEPFLDRLDRLVGDGTITSGKRNTSKRSGHSHAREDENILSGKEWSEMEILQTLKVYVDIRDWGVDQAAAIGRLATILDRSRGSIEAAVLAPAKEDPLWKGKRPHRGLTNKLAAALWKKYSQDLPGLIAEAARYEETLRVLRRKGRLP